MKFVNLLVCALLASFSVAAFAAPQESPVPLSVELLSDKVEWGDWYGPYRPYHWALRVEKRAPASCNGFTAYFFIFNDVVDRDGGAVNGPANYNHAYLNEQGEFIGVSLDQGSMCGPNGYKWIPTPDGKGLRAYDPFDKLLGTYHTK